MNETQTAKNVIEVIRDFVTNLGKEKVELEETKEVEEVKLAQMKLADGDVTIEAESFEAGQTVFIVNEDERVALPVGEYTLDDGSVLVVEEEGLIASIGEPQTEEEMESNSELDALKEQIKALLSKTEANELKLSEVTKENKELQEKLDNIPDASVINHAPVVLEQVEPKTAKERILFKIREKD